MVGGVVVERTVAEVLPELEVNTERLPQALKVYNFFKVLLKYITTANKYLIICNILGPT